ncbi:MBL fold metallo-hydrolase [Paenibacillus ihbetae]|uniref:Zn-dependent hydrolase n=1 Tax=Paenibacillus ihbetae TaxID=1870820 RepID=A0ABX3JQM4_9BACL|nr:MBL fold metallo-hydrolase [Paenibacillus ihbetae]OOC58873.1 Zn-dependent hydrolase [Paenibacillus ihbetae]
MMKLKVWGGAGEHGRSAYVLSGSGIKLLLDCGVKREGSGEYPLIEAEMIPHLDAVFLSHAHEDHSVAIPLLYRLGYTGEVWTTRKTASQAAAYLEKWRAFAGKVGALPYGEADCLAIQYRYLDEEADRLTWFEVIPGVEAMWGRSGHMAGSVWLLIRTEGKLIFYSGDYTTESMLLQADCPSLAPRKDRINGGLPAAIDVDLAIIDAAYGTDAETQEEKLKQLAETVRCVVRKGGKVLLPVPAAGRGQEMMLWAYRTFKDTPIVVEPGLLEELQRLLSSPEWLREREDGTARDDDVKGEMERLLRRDDLLIPASEEERVYLLEKLGASLWFIADGMMQTARAQWYYERISSHPDNLVLLTGHAARGTFAERLLQQPSLYGACEVKKLKFKVHQGCEDVRRMMSVMPARHNVLVHAVKEETDKLRSLLLSEAGAGHEPMQIHSMSAGEELYF